MFITAHSSTAMKWLVKRWFLVLAFSLLFPNVVIAVTLTMNVNPPGAGSVSPGASTIQNGNANVNISATANECYRFDHWDGNVADKYDRTTKIKMNYWDQTVTANFRLICTPT
ncbi:MAG: hypothetical protein WA151_12940, partial [Desulfatirhabdiaceae bacterium]